MSDNGVGMRSSSLEIEGTRRGLSFDKPPKPIQFAIEGRFTAVTRNPGTEVGIDLQRAAAAIRRILAHASGTGEFQVAERQLQFGIEISAVRIARPDKKSVGATPRRCRWLAQRSAKQSEVYRVPQTACGDGERKPRWDRGKVAVKVAKPQHCLIVTFPACKCRNKKVIVQPDPTNYFY